ncbi:MAG: hypothetical protein AB1416_07415 [Actinomycetota bacterium]
METRMIQIRNVPEPVHRRLKALAAEAGMTLSDYLLHEVVAVAALPSIEELNARISRREPVGDLGEAPAQVIRRIRDAAG